MTAAAIAAEGFALCSLNLGRYGISGWNLATGCSYNTSRPVHKPAWCSGQWSGVVCNSAYGIVSLSLYNGYYDYSSNLPSHSLPSTIAGLKSLTSLTLRYMQYTGSIPSALLRLTKLSQLDLESNSFTGTIPASLSNLQQLTFLRLGYNSFTGTLPAVLWSAMPRLISLTACCQRLSGLGSAGNTNGNVQVLQALDLSRNSLKGSLPSSVGLLTQLQSLNLEYCGLGGPLPSFIGSLTNLQSLYLSRNSIKGALPSFLGLLTNLQQLSLSNNQFTGTIPPSFQQMTALTSIELHTSSNWDYGKYQCDDNNGCHYSLTRKSPGLTGTLPAAMFTSMKNLNTLSLSGNSFSGPVPTTLATLTNLGQVYLDHNAFTGTIPRIFSSIPTPTSYFNGYYGYAFSLLLHANYLTGTLPQMNYGNPAFFYTFDQNCQLRSSYPMVALGPQNNCPPGPAGSLTPPTQFPTTAPTSG